MFELPFIGELEASLVGAAGELSIRLRRPSQVRIDTSTGALDDRG
jgi:hypothetical protein